MVQRFNARLLFVQFLVDLALTVGALKLAEIVRSHLVIGLERRTEFLAVQPWVYPLVLAIWTFFFLLLGVYDARRRRGLLPDMGTLWLAVSLAQLVLASSFYLLALVPPAAPSRLYIAYFYLLDVALLSLSMVAVYTLMSQLRKRGRHMRRVLLVGGGARARQVLVRLRGQQSAGIDLIGYVSREGEELPDLPRVGDLSAVPETVRNLRPHEVVLALPGEAHVDALRMTAELQETGVTVRIMPDLLEMVAMKARVDDFLGLPLISVTEPSIGPVQARVKRGFDLLVSAALLTVLSPVMAAIAIWVRLDSPGPALLQQTRVGAAGQPFTMWKFRTMRQGADTIPTEKTALDPRVTRAGRFLRRTSLDELPQLWNVVRGQMSLVGPRPELPAIVEGYEAWQLKRFNVPPGMTGWWQVNGRAERSMHRNTEIDLYYIQNYSILLDLRILWRTVGAVIRGRGAF